MSVTEGDKEASSKVIRKPTWYEMTFMDAHEPMELPRSMMEILLDQSTKKVARGSYSLEGATTEIGDVIDPRGRFF